MLFLSDQGWCKTCLKFLGTQKIFFCPFCTGVTASASLLRGSYSVDQHTPWDLPDLPLACARSLSNILDVLLVLVWGLSLEVRAIASRRWARREGDGAGVAVTHLAAVLYPFQGLGWTLSHSHCLTATELLQWAALLLLLPQKSSYWCYSLLATSVLLLIFFFLFKNFYVPISFFLIFLQPQQDRSFKQCSIPLHLDISHCVCSSICTKFFK